MTLETTRIAKRLAPARADERLDRELAESLADLDDAALESAESGFPTPSSMAMASARRLLTAMYKTAAMRFEIYPTPDGEIAIDAPADGGSVLTLCDSDGGALVLVNLPGHRRRERYASADALPNGFLLDALAKLGR